MREKTFQNTHNNLDSLQLVGSYEPVILSEFPLFLLSPALGVFGHSLVKIW